MGKTRGLQPERDGRARHSACSGGWASSASASTKEINQLHDAEPVNAAGIEQRNNEGDRPENRAGGKQEERADQEDRAHQWKARDETRLTTSQAMDGRTNKGEMEIEDAEKRSEREQNVGECIAHGAKSTASVGRTVFVGELFTRRRKGRKARRRQRRITW